VKLSRNNTLVREKRTTGRSRGLTLRLRTTAGIRIVTEGEFTVASYSAITSTLSRQTIVIASCQRTTF
jgi:hypothetical protein